MAEKVVMSYLRCPADLQWGNLGIRYALVVRSFALENLCLIVAERDYCWRFWKSGYWKLELTLKHFGLTLTSLVTEGRESSGLHDDDVCPLIWLSDGWHWGNDLEAVRNEEWEESGQEFAGAALQPSVKK